MTPSSSSSPTGGDTVSGEFPAGLRVLVVDDDPTCLKIIEHMLRKCLYRVTTCSRAVVALEMLRGKKGGFDLVLSDVYMPDMDGFKLLEHIGLEMDIPVIMMSANDEKDVVMKGVTHGARDYLIKPVSMEALKNIWQHAFRHKMRIGGGGGGGSKDMENSGSVDESEKQKRVVPSEDGDNASSGYNEGSWKVGKRKKEGGGGGGGGGEEEDEFEFEDREDSSTMKKPRVVWSVELHQQFVNAVNQLGIDKAVPKRILELMNVPGLTRENVASHLQKYRLYLKRVSPQQLGRTDPSFSSISDTAYSSISSLDGFDLQALAASGQIPPQTLMTLSSGQRRATNIGMDMSITDQTGFFDPDTQLANPSKIRPTIVQQVSNNQTNLIYGGSMEPRQIGQTQHNLGSYGGMGLQVSEGKQVFFNVPSSSPRTARTFPTGTINGLSNSVVMQMNQQGQQISFAQQQELKQFSAQQQVQSRGRLQNGIPGHVLVKTGTAFNGDTSLQGNYMNALPYSMLPQAIYTNFQNSNRNVNSNVPSSHNLIGMNQEARGLGLADNVNSLKKEMELNPNYDLCSDIRESKNQDWQLQNINVSYERGTKQGNIEFGSSTPSHQNFKDGTSRNTCTIRKEFKEIVSVEIEHGDCVPQNLLLPDDSYPNELMSIIGRQQEPDFGFDRYSFEA